MGDKSERERFNNNYKLKLYENEEEDGGVIKEQDRLLPIANVGRIMKQILPSNAKISKEAKETMQECVSEFISFVTGEASDKCHKEKRKTVNGDDICWALATLGFDDYAHPLKRYLFKFRESEGERANQNTAINNHNTTNNNNLVQPNHNYDDHHHYASTPTTTTTTAAANSFTNFSDNRGNAASNSHFSRQQFSNF